MENVPPSIPAEKVQRPSSSKLSGVQFGKAAVWMFGFWAVSRVLFVVIGLGGFVL